MYLGASELRVEKPKPNKSQWPVWVRGNTFKSQQEPIMLENLGDQHTLGFPVLLRYALTKKCTYSKTWQKSLASFASDWLRGWLKSSGPMTLQTKAEIKKS